jgi:hypothetical protein
MDAVALLNGIVIFMQVLSFGFMTAGAVLALDEAVRSDRRPNATARGESVEVRAVRVVQREKWT